MLCDGTYKNGSPCRNNHLPGYTRCGIHGGFSIKSAIREGNLAELQRILSTTTSRIRADDFINACAYRHLDIIKYILDQELVHPFIEDRMYFKYESDPEIIALFPTECSLCDAINKLTVKSEPCCICLSDENIEVLVLPCCKNVMCSTCIRSWNSEQRSCAFCRAKVF